MPHVFFGPSYVNLTTSTGPLAAIPELYKPGQAGLVSPPADLRWVENLKLRVSPAAAEALSQSEKVRAFFKQDECDAFVLIADLRRSTDLMLKATSPKAFGAFVTELMYVLHVTITKNYGVVDKFMGDGVLAYFPLKFSGDDAGFHAATAAEECHAQMERLYRAHHSAFRAVVATGFGIGIDLGSISFIHLHDGVTVVGQPVVYASRFAQGATAGQTILNQLAYDAIVSRFGRLFSLSETWVEIKNERPHLGYLAKRNKKAFKPTGPGWPTLAAS